MLDSWPPEWRDPHLAAHDEATIQRQKDVTKLLARQKRNEQLAKEVRASREAAKAAEKIIAAVATTMQEERGLDLTTGHGKDDMVKGANLSTTSTQLKRPCETE